MSKQLSNEEFINKCKQIHGDTYDYSYINYQGMRNPITVKCKEHGFWRPLASNFVSGRGCPICGQYNKSPRGKNITTESFIEKASEIHGDKYDYSKVKYINSTTPVKIICPIHGEFQQSAHAHLHTKAGCPVCANINRGLTQKITSSNSFIKKAREIHGDKYDYSLINFKNQNEYGTIICPIHGRFRQILSSHLAGKGCPHCNLKFKLTTKEFIEKAIKVHNGFYSYDKVIYTGSRDEVLITCPIHGDFLQIAGNHLSGQGCPECANENKRNTFLKSTEEFIKQAKSIHQNDDGTPKYDYSKTIYTGKTNKVIIICPIHGEFEQRAENHINSNCGCPSCISHRSKGEIEVYEFIKSILNS